MGLPAKGSIDSSDGGDGAEKETDRGRVHALHERILGVQMRIGHMVGGMVEQAPLGLA
jgi:hypothetical protein